jgi:hypothetical protein
MWPGEAPSAQCTHGWHAELGIRSCRCRVTAPAQRRRPTAATADSRVSLTWNCRTHKDFRTRSCGRVAEGGGLLNRYTLQRRIEGSNPSGSASLQARTARVLAHRRVRTGSNPAIRPTSLLKAFACWQRFLLQPRGRKACGHRRELNHPPGAAVAAPGELSAQIYPRAQFCAHAFLQSVSALPERGREQSFNRCSECC